MEVEFQDSRAALVETDEATKSGYPPEVISAIRQKLVVIRAAPDDRTLRNLRSLQFMKLKRPGSPWSIRLTKQWRLVFTIDTTRSPARISVLGVEERR